MTYYFHLADDPNDDALEISEEEALRFVRTLLGDAGDAKKAVGQIRSGERIELPDREEWEAE